MYNETALYHYGIPQTPDGKGSGRFRKVFSAAQKAGHGIAKGAKAVGSVPVKLTKNLARDLLAKHRIPTWLFSDETIRSSNERAGLLTEWAAGRNRYLEEIGKKTPKEIKKEQMGAGQHTVGKLLKTVGSDTVKSIAKDTLTPIASGLALNAITKGMKNKGVSQETIDTVLSFVKNNKNNNSSNNNTKDNKNTPKEKTNPIQSEVKPKQPTPEKTENPKPVETPTASPITINIVGNEIKKKKNKDKNKDKKKGKIILP